MNRIASHQLWLGTHALDIGAITPLFYTFRDREEILKIFEKYCGARLTTHAFRIGGLQYEAYEGFEKDVKNFLTFFAPKIDEYEELLTTNRIWLERTKGVGVISGPDEEYDQRHWWTTSAGVRTVLDEVIAYLYAKFLFHPSQSRLESRARR